MSIEYCFDCDKHVDTDYDLEHECSDSPQSKPVNSGASRCKTGCVRDKTADTSHSEDDA